MRYALLTIFAITAIPFLSGCETSPESRAAKSDALFEKAQLSLRTENDADSLAAAGLLNIAKHRDQSLRLVAQATANSPDRPDLLWLHIRICQVDANCDSAPFERKLRTLDAQNGAGWLGELIRADTAKDEQAMLVALEAISRSERFDIYWTTLIARLSPVIAKTKAMSLMDAETTVIGLLAAQTIPAYQVASNACRGDRLAQHEVIAICRGVAKSLMQGDTYITQMMGVAIAERVWPATSSQWKMAAEARRVWDYQRSLSTHVYAWNMAHTDQYLALCAQNRREQDVYREVLIASGKDPDPPLS